jgi:hypothetical protein
VAISATNTAGTTEAILSIDISAAPFEPPVISSSAGANGVAGVQFFYAITASDRPDTFSATGLPAGLTLDPATGIITGVAVVSTATAKITASNALGTGTASLRIIIGSATLAASHISSGAAASGVVGTAFSYSITATRSPGSFAATNLPPGLGVDTSTGVISGVPTTTGTYAVSVAASGATGIVTMVIGAGSPTVRSSPVLRGHTRFWQKGLDIKSSRAIRLKVSPSPVSRPVFRSTRQRDGFRAFPPPPGPTLSPFPRAMGPGQEMPA